MLKMHTALTFVTLFMVCCLTGCSDAYNESINELAVNKAEIYDSPEYIEYKQNEDEYNEFEEEYAKDNSAQEAVPVIGKVTEGIKVTFAGNAFFDTVFYEVNGSEKTPINVDDASYIIKPGSTVYADKPKNKNENSNYKFKDFKVIDFSENKDENLSGKLRFVADNDGYVLKFPENYLPTDISVFPIGGYTDRTINCTVYHLSGNGVKSAVSSVTGSWSINTGTLSEQTKDIDNTTVTNITIDPASDYKVIFCYDAENYYMDGKLSTQGYNEVPIGSGYVSFEQKSPTDKTSDYTAVLRSYSKILFNDRTVLNKGVKAVRVNNEDVTNSVIDSVTKTVKKLRYGDSIILDVNNSYAAYCNVPGFASENIGSGTRYRMTVGTDSAVISLIKKSDDNPVSLYTPVKYDNVSEVHIFSTYNKESCELIEGSGIAAKDKINVEITAEPGYRFIGRNASDGGTKYKAEMTYAEFSSGAIQSVINSQLKKYYSATLLTSDEHGDYTYELDGTPVEGGKLWFYSGQKLKVTYTIRSEEKYRIVSPMSRFLKIKKDSAEKELNENASGKTLDIDFFEIRIIRDERAGV